MTSGEEKVPLSRRPPRGHSSVLQRMGREATAQKSDDFMTPVYHIYEVRSASKFQASHRKSPFESAMLLTSRIRGKSLATTSPPSSACRTKALACTRYRLCHWCLNHHALRRRAKHAFVPWTVFDIAGVPVSFSIMSVAEGQSRTGTDGFGDRCSHELHRRQKNTSNNRANPAPKG